MTALTAAITHLNGLAGTPGYVHDTFSKEARFFQPFNAARIDAARDVIAREYAASPLYPILLTSLIEAADRVDSTTGVQMAYVKQWAPRSANPLTLRVPELLPGPGHAVLGDALVMAGALGTFDLAYLDPPYNQHRYFTNYHVWETLVAWDAPEPYGVARKRIDRAGSRHPERLQLQADHARCPALGREPCRLRTAGAVVQRRIMAGRRGARDTVWPGALGGDVGLRLGPLRGSPDRDIRPFGREGGPGVASLQSGAPGHCGRGGVGAARRRGGGTNGERIGSRTPEIAGAGRRTYDGRGRDGRRFDGSGRDERSRRPPRGSASIGVVTTAGDHYARLEDADLSARMSKDEEAKRLTKAQLRVLHLRLINGGQLTGGKLGPPVCIVLEGWDAAGKGGAIKRLVEPLDPRHVHIAPFAAPTPDELRHHFLWRFWPPLPGWGGLTIFDRSWYGRVLVERVENLATEVQWRRAYDEINDFEHSLAEEGMVVIKLWLHMSHEEQLRRFERRRDDTLKSWKLTEEDWRNREKRAQYNEAVSDMLRLTDGPLAHWDVISSENKRNGRVEVIETVIRRMEEGMARWGIEVPSPDDEEEQRTQAALAFDDAEFQSDGENEGPGPGHDPDPGSGHDSGSGADPGSGPDDGSSADPGSGPDLRAVKANGRPPTAVAAAPNGQSPAQSDSART